MGYLDSFFFLSTIRSGTAFIAWFYTFVSIVGLEIITYLVISIAYSKWYRPASMLWIYVGVDVMFLVMLICACCAIHGVRKDISGLLYPLLIFQVLLSAAAIAVFIWMATSFFIPYNVLFLVDVFVLNVYFFLVVLSHCHGMKYESIGGSIRIIRESDD